MTMAPSGSATSITLPLHNDSRKLVEYLLSDLRTLSTEAKKKHNNVKEASELGIVKVRNISTSSCPDQLLKNLRLSCAEVIHPLILGCSTKNPKLVQISLQAIQRMLQFCVIDRSSTPTIVNELWNLTEAECEELRVLQTITPFVSTELLVTNDALAKCIVLAIKLNFSKDPSVINAASAAVRQLFSCVFERVVQEDGLDFNDITVNNYSQPNCNLAPSSLKFAAADGYLLLRDLILLIRKENTLWLYGVKHITITLALELLESVLKHYPSIFTKHVEYADLLRNQICPQLIKLFAGENEFKLCDHIYENDLNNQKSLSAVCHDIMAAPLRPIFPILMRSLRISSVLLIHYHALLVTHNEIIIGFLLELIYTEGFLWQTAMALEILHKIVVQPNFLFWLCENYEFQPGVTKLIRLILQSIISYIKKSLEEATSQTSLSDGSQFFGQSGFLYKGAFILLHENISHNKRWILLDWLEKHEPGPVPDGYCLSVAYMCLIDCTHSIYSAVEERHQIDHKKLENEKTSLDDIGKELFLSTYRYLLDGLSVLLSCSADDSISDAILNCFSTIILLSCRVGTPESKDFSFKIICQAAFPPGYFYKFIESVSSAYQCQNTSISKELSTVNFFSQNWKDKDGLVGVQSQIVAIGTICPISSLSSSMFNTNVMLSSKNMQVSRVLIACAQQNGPYLTHCWDMVLSTVQHLVWILGMRPTSATNFRTGSDSSLGLLSSTVNSNMTGGVVSGNVILTTVVSSELPDLNQSLNKLFESTYDFNDVNLHHVIAALCKLSSEAMIVAQNTFRDPSLFPVAKLLHISLVNLQRLEVFWKPMTAHLLEICSHTNTSLRDWSTMAITTLVKCAMKKFFNGSNPTNLKSNDGLANVEQLILAPLASMSEVEFVDVKTKQLDCLMHILQSNSQALTPQIWPLVIKIVTSAVDSCSDAQLIEQGYQTMTLVIKEFLNILPFECVCLLVETDAKYGKQLVDLNVSLSAVGQLWDVSDYVSRESAHCKNEAEVENVWLVLFDCLSSLCVDARPPVRKSACDTLLQTVAAHGQALKLSTWSQMVWKIFFPMLDKVSVLTNNASTFPTNTVALGASNIMIHHSRDTESKQWAETTVKALSGVVKIFNSQRSKLSSLECFPQYWARLLDYIEVVSAANNSEMSLAALKNFQELLFGSQQLSDGREKQNLIGDVSTPHLPDKLWMVSWQSWLKISQIITSPHLQPDATHTENILKLKAYIPGSFHLTTLLNVFILLFNRVGRFVLVKEMYFKNVPLILKNISSIPPSDQTLFVENAQNSELSLTQERILDCVRLVFQEQIDNHTKLKTAIPNMLLLLLNFVEYAIRPPITQFSPMLTNNENQFQSTKQNLIAFAELSLRMAVEYYSKVASFIEIIELRTLIDIIKCLSEPLALKYHCPYQTTWKIAATSFIKVCQIGLPISREHLNLYTALWPQLGNTIEKFLFSTSKPSVPLNADERKRHEFVDCLIIELIRTQILPYANILPCDFMKKIIEILNRGSINTMDANDVMASDSFQHCADLSRVCFDALLSISRSGNQTNDLSNPTSDNPKKDLVVLRYAGEISNSVVNKNDFANSLGTTAINSLLSRCTQVLNNYARDEQNSGHFRLPQERIFEAVSILRAVSTLIDEFGKQSNNPHSALYSNLVGLYPNLIQMIPSCRSDKQLELALMTALNSYQTLLLINIHRF